MCIRKNYEFFLPLLSALLSLALVFFSATHFPTNLFDQITNEKYNFLMRCRRRLSLGVSMRVYESMEFQTVQTRAHTRERESEARERMSDTYLRFFFAIELV